MPCRLGHRLYKLWTPRKRLFNKVILIMIIIIEASPKLVLPPCMQRRRSLRLHHNYLGVVHLERCTKARVIDGKCNPVAVKVLHRVCFLYFLY